MDFMIGCNYWASNAGAEMWRDFDPIAIEKDLKLLSENGIRYLRAFPNWRDFQPVEPLVGGMGRLSRYTQKGKVNSDNPYFLDMEMMDRFEVFLELCSKYGIKVIVGLITGWMSGGLFVPPALCGENIITSPKAHYFQNLFVKGFVERFKDSEAVYAWDLGNECNCMGFAESRWEVCSWVAMISNAIKAADPSRQVISGMHGLVVSGKWTIEDQGLFTDMLTTHPYPFWGEFTKIDETLSLRTLMYPTVQSKFYSNIGKKPCLAEEIGTMGPMICSDESAADFIRVNALSLWANGATGVMWWCASDQTELESFPYSDQMVERELGMFDNDHQPKPVLKETKKISALMEGFDFTLPAVRNDAVCLLSRDQRHWGVAYMTYILARQAGLNCQFAFADSEIPDSDIYLLPSVNAYQIMTKDKYEQLKGKVREGADLYISLDNAVLSGFEELTGLKVLDSYEFNERGSATVGGKKIEFSRTRNIIAEPTTAVVLARDDKDRPFLTVNEYGKGRVFFVNAPIENGLVDKRHAFELGADSIYREIFKDAIDNQPIKLSDDRLLTTYHPTVDGAYAVVINYYAQPIEFTVELDNKYEIERICYGSKNKAEAFDACVFKLKIK